MTDKKPMTFEEKLEKAADAFETDWHKRYPQGMTVADYCNTSVPAECFDRGARWAHPVVREETVKEIAEWFRSTSAPDDRQNVREIADESERRFLTHQEGPK